ncbi:MAG: NAD-dependent epimerase/dehydratase family protein [Planctomycetes bacterium]|nr:NAD-dependent epimerase/dehydratase family protein [Planctomycetota bacterium]
MSPRGPGDAPGERPGRRAFVTGAAGFIGANLVRALLADGFHVRALVRLGSDLSSLEGLDVEIVEGSLLDGEGLASRMEGCAACFHLAARISGSADELRSANVEGTRAVLTAAVRAGCRAVVHTSTLGTLARPDGSPARETDSLLLPGASGYVRSKHLAEQEARALASRGAPVVIVHPSAPVGPFDKTPTVTGRRILEVLRGKLPRWIAGRINHVAVRDVARGMILAAERGVPGTSYLLAREGGDLSRDELVALVAGAARIEPPARRGARSLLGWLRRRRSAEAGGPPSLACDPSWTVRELGLPQTPLEEAFAEAVAWFRGRGMAP